MFDPNSLNSHSLTLEYVSPAPSWIISHILRVSYISAACHKSDAELIICYKKRGVGR